MSESNFLALLEWQAQGWQRACCLEAGIGIASGSGLVHGGVGRSDNAGLEELGSRGKCTNSTSCSGLNRSVEVGSAHTESRTGL